MHSCHRGSWNMHVNNCEPGSEFNCTAESFTRTDTQLQRCRHIHSILNENKHTYVLNIQHTIHSYLKGFSFLFDFLGGFTYSMTKTHDLYGAVCVCLLMGQELSMGGTHKRSQWPNHPWLTLTDYLCVRVCVWVLFHISSFCLASHVTVADSSVLADKHREHPYCFTTRGGREQMYLNSFENQLVKFCLLFDQYSRVGVNLNWSWSIQEVIWI